MEDGEHSTLDYIRDYLRLTDTGKRKRKLNRLLDEHKAFFSSLARVTQPARVSIPPENLEPESIYSQQVLLNHITNASAIQPLPLLYTSTLQHMLTRLGIEWPAGVFSNDMNSEGSGRKPSTMGKEAERLHREQHLGWSAVAKTLIPEEYKANPKKARDKVRILAKPFSPTRSE